MDFVIKTKGK